jgi:TRAP-type mannitol/chloroaromatic compound transport system permease small subunit
MPQEHTQLTVSRDSRLGLLKKIADKLDLVVEWQGKAASFLIVIATLQICFELVLRYFFNAPTTWGLELTVYLCGVTYLMSGAFAERYGAHIRVDIFYNNWSPRTRACFDLLVADMFLFFFSGVLLWFGILWFLEAKAQSLTSGTIWDPVIWPMRLMIVWGAFSLLISGIPKFLRDFAYVFWEVEI